MTFEIPESEVLNSDVYNKDIVELEINMTYWEIQQNKNEKLRVEHKDLKQ